MDVDFAACGINVHNLVSFAHSHVNTPGQRGGASSSSSSSCCCTCWRCAHISVSGFIVGLLRCWPASTRRPRSICQWHTRSLLDVCVCVCVWDLASTWLSYSLQLTHFYSFQLYSFTKQAKLNYVPLLLCNAIFIDCCSKERGRRRGGGVAVGAVAAAEFHRNLKPNRAASEQLVLCMLPESAAAAAAAATATVVISIKYSLT